jgi:hypothetical protein
MRVIRSLLFLAIGLCLWQNSAFSAVAYVKKSAVYQNAASETVTTVVSTAYTGGSGHLLVFAYAGYTGTTFDPAGTSISDGHNTWHRGPTEYTYNGSSLEIWYCMDAYAGTYTISMTHTAQVYNNAQVFEFSGVASTSAFDQGSGGNGNSTSQVTPASGTLAIADEVVFAMYVEDNTHSSYSVAGGWTLPTSGADYNNKDFVSEYNLVAATTSIAGALTAATASPNSYVSMLATFKGIAGDVTAPTLSTATVGTNGTSLTFAFSETVSIGAGGNGGFTISPSGGAATVSYTSGSGSSSLVYTINRTILQGETFTFAYTQPGNGVEDAAGNDLATITSTSGTNNSTQTGATPTHKLLSLLGVGD